MNLLAFEMCVSLISSLIFPPFSPFPNRNHGLFPRRRACSFVNFDLCPLFYFDIHLATFFSSRLASFPFSASRLFPPPSLIPEALLRRAASLAIRGESSSSLIGQYEVFLSSQATFLFGKFRIEFRFMAPASRLSLVSIPAGSHSLQVRSWHAPGSLPFLSLVTLKSWSGYFTSDRGFRSVGRDFPYSGVLSAMSQVEPRDPAADLCWPARLFAPSSSSVFFFSQSSVKFSPNHDISLLYRRGPRSNPFFGFGPNSSFIPRSKLLFQKMK